MKFGVLVRDKDGRPKFQRPELIKRFARALTDDDWQYLHNKFGDEWIDLNAKRVKK